MLTDLQEYNLLLMREFDAHCRKHGIRYYIAGGSVIGALRHKGFIPWDDDLDVYMVRDQWELFKTTFFAHRPANRELVCSDIDPNYPNVTAKYVATDTTAVYRNLLTGQNAAGIIIDILILDPVPDDEECLAEYRRNLLLYNEFVNPYYVFSARFEEVSPYEAFRELEVEFGHGPLVKMLEEELTKYPDTETSKYCVRWGGVPHIFERNLFGTPRYVAFEDMLLPTPEKSYLYLSQLYGEDWVEIPPHSNEIVHDVVYSTMNSYESFFEDYCKYIDSEAYVKTVTARKINRLRAAQTTRTVQDRTQMLRARWIAKNIIRSNERESLRDMLVDGRIDELESVFARYFSEQCSTQYLGNKFHAGFDRYYRPVYCNIGDDLCGVAVELMCRKGQIHYPKRVIEARRFNDEAPLSAELEWQYRDLNRIVAAIDMLEGGRYAESLACAKEVHGAHPSWTAPIKLMITLLEEHADGLAVAPKTACEDIRALIAAGKKINPSDGDWLKYEGDLLRIECPLKAVKLYERARESTRNGYTLLKIDEFMEDHGVLLANAFSELVRQGNRTTAASLLKNTEDYFDIDALSTNSLMTIANEDPHTVERIIRKKKERLLSGPAKEDDHSLDAYWHTLSSYEHEQEALVALWGKRLAHEPISFKEDDRQNTIPSKALYKEIGDAAFAKCAYPAAFGHYYRAMDGISDNALLKAALSEVFIADIAYFHERMCTPGTSAKKVDRVFCAWMLRHKTIENWLSAIRALDIIPLSAVENLFDPKNPLTFGEASMRSDDELPTAKSGDSCENLEIVEPQANAALGSTYTEGFLPLPTDESSSVVEDGTPSTIIGILSEESMRFLMFCSLLNVLSQAQARFSLVRGEGHNE